MRALVTKIFRQFRPVAPAVGSPEAEAALIARREAISEERRATRLLNESNRAQMNVRGGFGPGL